MSQYEDNNRIVVEKFQFFPNRSIKKKEGGTDSLTFEEK